MAFHLGCLRALNRLQLLDQIGVISTISGGSVIGAYFAYMPGKSFEEFEADIRRMLRQGFQRSIAQELIRPRNLIRAVKGQVRLAVAELRATISRTEPSFKRVFSRTELFSQILQRDVFAGLQLDSPTKNDIKVVIGACELRSGVAFRFGNEFSGDWRHGRTCNNHIPVAIAVAASAAYPIFLPALDRTWLFEKQGTLKEERVLLTDGGIYDNLGVLVLEPGRNPAFSLHCIPCDYIIACNAGRGQDDGSAVSLGFRKRVTRAFEVVHKRVQESTMHHLHYLKQSDAIKAFVLPYLGQMDEQIPNMPADLIPRSEVIGYPTNFGPMSEDWIDKLSRRGDQLTRHLVPLYLTEV